MLGAWSSWRDRWFDDVASVHRCIRYFARLTLFRRMVRESPRLLKVISFDGTPS